MGTTAEKKSFLQQDIEHQARALIDAGDLDAAQALLERSLSVNVTAPAAYCLGLVHAGRSERAKAVHYFETALGADPSYVPAYAAAAEVFLQDGHALHAMDCYARAIKENPHDIVLKEKFLNLARSASFAQFNPHLKELYTECLRTPETDFSNMGTSVFSLLRRDPALGKLYKALDRKNYKTFRKALAGVAHRGSFLDPFFILVLKKPVRIVDMGFERFLTHVRRMLLETYENPAQIFSGADEVTTLVEALAHYCYHTEYAFALTEEEKEKLSVLRTMTPDSLSLAVLACYMPLHALENARAIGEKFTGSAIDSLIKIQITDYFDQEEIRKAIPSLTETTDSVSMKVKAQYEESPYPRWNSFAKIMYAPEIEGRMAGKEIDILVAGCGTGHEAVELAYVFPQAQVLAVDLSYASLAYGAKKAKEFGIKNIDFRQADILKLGTLGKQFDYIASSGVLHHMENPHEGWRIVSGLLKPGGLMRLCLYSRLSRQSLARAQEVIRKKGYSSSADDIRRFRADARAILKGRDYKKITNYIDFYSISECRDLLFHVQEKSLTLPEIKEWLDEAGMEFLGFYTAKETLNLYRKLYPQDPTATDLDLWHAFEEKHPDTFTSMYRLWLQKR